MKVCSPHVLFLKKKHYKIIELLFKITVGFTLKKSCNLHKLRCYSKKLCLHPGILIRLIRTWTKSISAMILEERLPWPHSPSFPPHLQWSGHTAEKGSHCILVFATSTKFWGKPLSCLGKKSSVSHFPNFLPTFPNNVSMFQKTSENPNSSSCSH